MTDYPFWLNYAQQDGLRDLDVAFGRFLFDINAKDDISLCLSVLTSYQLRNGNPCLNLDAFCKSPMDFVPPSWSEYLSDADTSIGSLTTDRQILLNQLKQSDYIGTGKDIKPLIMVGNNIYLYKYWQAANNIIYSINKFLDKSFINSTNFDLYKNLLSDVFTAQDIATGDIINWQKMACAIALHNQFAIITGGPGTGKTTTVVRLLCILQALAINDGNLDGLRISLAAPTGKAAARLNESISLALKSLGFSGNMLLNKAVPLVPKQVNTLHGLLGVRFNSRFFTHNEKNPLDLDVLVIDEASMMDIEMFDAVFRALPNHARLIILGDKDQLASVEAGAIMGELCARSYKAYYTSANASFIADLTNQSIPASLVDNNGTRLDQAVAMLRKSFRFHENSGIGKLAVAVNNADITTVRNLFNSNNNDLEFFHPASNSPDKWSSVLFTQSAYPALFSFIQQQRPNSQDSQRQWDEYALAVLEQQTRLQILCALRQGPWGTNAINSMVENRLNAAGYIKKTASEWYVGRPVMVLRNRPDIGLANGDIGVVLAVPDILNSTRSILRVAFINSSNGNIIWLSPARLDQIETVFALTVHKSQGSEFEHVIFVLPDSFSPVMTKELLYTGITRAKNRLSMVVPNGIKTIEMAISNPTKRSKALITELIL